MAAKFGIPVCPHAGGVGLCEYVQHLLIFDYICVSATLENRMIEYICRPSSRAFCISHATSLQRLQAILRWDQNLSQIMNFQMDQCGMTIQASSVLVTALWFSWQCCAVTTCKLVYTYRSVMHGIASFPGLLHLLLWSLQYGYCKWWRPGNQATMCWMLMLFDIPQ